ncbi:hypothetical protein ACET3Z_009767 [Daucus carota]
MPASLQWAPQHVQIKLLRPQQLTTAAYMRNHSLLRSTKKTNTRISSFSPNSSGISDISVLLFPFFRANNEQG